MRPALEYHDVFEYCSGILSCRMTQQRNFSAFVWSILSQRSCTIAAAARSLESTKTYATKRQQLKRFLRWKNITLSEVSQVVFWLQSAVGVAYYFMPELLKRDLARTERPDMERWEAKINPNK